MNKYLQEKVEFVSGLNEAVAGKVSSIAKIEYVIFADKDHENWTDEFLVVHYNGGAYQARCCSGNSNAAILEELGGMIWSSQHNRRGTNDTPYFDKMTENNLLQILK